MKKYNVLLLITDQHRFDALSCYGNDKIETPNIDWLASEGTVFNNAYTPSPSCVPARACLLSGQNQWNAGILGMGRGQKEMGIGFENTLPGELTKSGYYTKAVGKMHFFPQRSLNGYHHIELDESGREFDTDFISDYKEWFDKNKDGDYHMVEHGIDWNSWMARPYHAPEYLHPTNWTANRSIRFIRNRDRSMPFLLKTSFARPHSPYDPPQHYYDLYKDREVPKAWVGDWAKMHDVPADGARHSAWRGVRTDIEIERARKAYYGQVTHIDSQIGKMLMYMQKKGTLDDTIIIFTSDHGDMLGDHNLWRKTYAYEGSAHIPMIIRLPKELQDKKVSHVDEVVTLYDIMPTILDIVGADIPETVDGKSMYSLIKGEEDDWREYFHGEHCQCYSYEQDMHYLTDGHYKYVWLPQLHKEQLFNLDNDREELYDLSGDDEYKDVLKMWRDRMVNELEPRDAGLTLNGELVCQKGKPPIVSPKYEERVSRVEI